MATESQSGFAASSSDVVRARFVMSAFWSLGGAVVARGLTLAASVFAGRLLGATGFGEIGMIQSTQELFGVLAGAGLGLAATKFVAEHCTTDGLKAARYMQAVLTLAVILGVLGAGGLLAFTHVLAAAVFGAPELADPLRAAAALLLFSTLTRVQTGVLMGLGDFRMVAMLGMLRGAILFVALIVGVSSMGIMGGVIGLVLAEGMAMAANQVALTRQFATFRTNASVQSQSNRLGWGWFGKGLGPELKTLCRFSGLAVLGSLCTTLAFWASNVMLVSQPDGFASLGLFNAAERWRQLLLFLPASVAPIVLSMLSNLHGTNDPAGYRKVIGMNLFVQIAAVIVPAVLVAVCAPVAMGVFGAEYRDGWLTLVLLAVSAVASVLNTFLGHVLVSQGGIRWRFALDVLLAGVLALVSWRLVPAYRDLGLAYANVAAYGMTALGLIWPVTHYMRRVSVQDTN